MGASNHKNTPHQWYGEYDYSSNTQGQNALPSIALHKGGHPLWRSGCGYLIASLHSSSANQLPILAALHARFPTLFGIIIHDILINVNREFSR